MLYPEEIHLAVKNVTIDAKCVDLHGYFTINTSIVTINKNFG